VIKKPSRGAFEFGKEAFHPCDRATSIASERSECHGNISAEADIDVTAHDPGSLMIVAGVREFTGRFLQIMHMEGVALLPTADHTRFAFVGGGMRQIDVPEMPRLECFAEEFRNHRSDPRRRFFPVQSDPAPQEVGQGDAADPRKGRLAHCRDSARDGKVVAPEIAAMVDPGEDPVGPHRHEVGQSDAGAVGRRPSDRKTSLPPFFIADRSVRGDAMADLRHLGSGRDDPDLVKKSGGDSVQRREALGIDTVVVGQKRDHIFGKRGKGFSPASGRVYLSGVNPTQELLYFDRYESRLKSEGIYGENPLRWAYETTLGRLCLEGIIKRRWFSRLYGRWADTSGSAKEIAPFLERFGVDAADFVEDPATFRTFNEFFHRRLKPQSRPIAAGEKTISFPADGRHFYIPDLSRESHLYAKGQRLELAELLGDEALATRFACGSAVLSRLCPTDYHRFHFPLDGECGTPRLINGDLYSVNPIALSRGLGYLLENKRRITRVTRPDIGEYLFLEIGATNVGSIVDTCAPGTRVARGEEKGYFRFGGSMTIVIFSENSFVPAPDLAAQSAAGIELYARMGDAMGNLAE